MEILQPGHNKKANRVKNWKEIREEALELKQFVDKGNFSGLHERAFAISQPQVSEDPKNYFVINETLDKVKLIKSFGHWCIINLKIVKKKSPVYFKEGCMSFPHRKYKSTERFNKITVTYWTPFLWFLIPRRKKFEGLCAFIAAHESDHAKGINIYGK